MNEATRARFSPAALLCALLAVIAETAGAGVDSDFTPANEFGQNKYLVEFAEPGLMQRHVGRESGERFDFNSPRARAEWHDVMATQDIHRQAMTAALNRSLEVSHHFLITHSGIAVWLDPQEAASVRQLEGVISVERERLYRLSTYRGPTFIDADSIWDGSAVPGGDELRGEGMVVGVLDTGIPADYANHDSFANDAACGHGEDGAPDKVLSTVDCTSTDAGGLCNGSSPGDTHGHGTHVASTAAGNKITATATPQPTIPGSFTEMSGVAPCARIRAYRVCPGSCPGAAIQAGLNHVLADGDVDVVNFSISGGRDPWNDNDRRKLDLVDAGILVAAAAGNTSRTITNPVGQVNHLGPWVLTVAASSRDTNNDGKSARGDVLANFSLRGPTPDPLQDLQKPDITAPGINIYAASMDSGAMSYGFKSGTSMASPHVAGAATLVRQARPSWTPSEVKSALMMTSSTSGKKEDGKTDWDADDVGSGRVDLSKAALTGLVMNETTANYLAADPASDGDTTTLNIPAVRNFECTPSCTWTRTVRNTLNESSSWTVESNVFTSDAFEITVDPVEFSFDGNISETQTLEITATPVSNELSNTVGFGEVVLTSSTAPDAHITVAIQGKGDGTAPNACEKSDI